MAGRTSYYSRGSDPTLPCHWSPRGGRWEHYAWRARPLTVTRQRTQTSYWNSLGRLPLPSNNMRAYEEIADLKARLQQESLYLQEEIKLGHNFEEIIGSSQGLRSTLERVDAVAPTDSTVLILGETGTGKELIARAIHDPAHRGELDISLDGPRASEG